MPEIPDNLTESEARKILDDYAPQVRTLSEEIMRNNARAEQGEQAKAELMRKATEHFGVPDGKGGKVIPDGEAGVKRILTERTAENARNVRIYLADFFAAQEKVQALAKAASPR